MNHQNEPIPEKGAFFEYMRKLRKEKPVNKDPLPKDPLIRTSIEIQGKRVNPQFTGEDFY